MIGMQDPTLIDLEPAENLPVLTMAKKAQMESEIANLTNLLNKAEFKRQETLTKNQDLLARVAEKDQEVSAVTHRFNLLKSKKANGFLKDEYAQL